MEKNKRRKLIADKTEGCKSTINRETKINIEGFNTIFKDSQIPLEVLTRHFLIMGETGSGKTVSGVAHILAASLKELNEYSMLIVDPKQNELQRICKGVLKQEYDQKVIDVKKIGGQKILFFEGWENEDISFKAEKLWQLHPIKPEHESHNRYFFEKAKTFFFTILKLEEELRNIRSEELKNIRISLLDKSNKNSFFEKLEDFITEVKKFDNKYLEDLLADIKLKAEVCECKIDHSLYSWLEELTNNNNNKYITELAERRKQLSYDFDYLNQLFRIINDKKVIEIIDFDPFATEGLSIKKAILDKKVLIFSPDASYSSEAQDLIGKTLKKKYFQFVFKTYDDRERSFPVFYICDEFQRFITSDSESGEQNFLDRCRAYITVCVLSTQSISSLINATNNEYAVEIILENTGNKIFFRSTSPKVFERLKQILPSPPHEGFHIINVRPPTTLKAGECYYIIANGSWGRVRLPKYEFK